MAPAGYGGRQAVIDLLGGARNPRRPARYRDGEPVPWRWLLLLCFGVALAQGLDIYLRDPIAARDLPAALRPYAVLVNVAALPLINVLVVAICALLFTAGAKVFVGSRLGLRQIATAIVLGLWASVLPVLLVNGIGGGFGLKLDLVAVLVGAVTVGYVAPSLAEMAGIGIGRAVAAILIGPLVLVLAVGAGLLLFGFAAKFAGFRL